METVLHIIIEPNFIGIGIGIGSRAVETHHYNNNKIIFPNLSKSLLCDILIIHVRKSSWIIHVKNHIIEKNKVLKLYHVFYKEHEMTNWTDQLQIMTEEIFVVQWTKHQTSISTSINLRITISFTFVNPICIVIFSYLEQRNINVQEGDILVN